jgi:tetratricopeptide (TPR) repeat protein
MDSYKEKFTVGSLVRIADYEVLYNFQRTWKYHNKLSSEQLEFAGRVVQVKEVGFYHGGDVLYVLRGVPGVWHEQCLQSANITKNEFQMTPEQIEEHNRASKAAAQLIEGEIIVHGSQPPSKYRRSVRLKLERALQLYARVLEINPSNWSAMWLVGKIHQRFGDNSTALAWFSRAHRINPLHADVAREASICAMALGRSEEAISYACVAMQSQPHNSGLQANLALAFLLADKLDDAKVTIEKAILSDPKDKMSQTIRNMVDHFIDGGKRPPSTTGELEDYWKKCNKWW